MYFESEWTLFDLVDKKNWEPNMLKIKLEIQYNYIICPYRA